VGRLPGGGTYIVRHETGTPLAALSLWYRAPSTGYGQAPVRSLSRMAAYAVAASEPITGTPLSKVVADLGGRLQIESYATSVEVSALVPASRAPAVLKALTASYFAPVVTPAGVKAAQGDLAAEALQAPYRIEGVMRDALFAQLFPDGPAHYETPAAPQELTKLSLDEIKAFAARAFRAQNAFLVLAGDVDPALARAAVAGRPAGSAPSAARMEPPLALAPSVAGAPLTQHAAEPGSGLAWIGPGIADEKAATALDFVADYLFRPDDGVVARRVAEKFPDTFVTGQFITLYRPGVMVVEATGKGSGAARKVIEEQLSALAQPLSAEVFGPAREAFIYHLLSDLQTPQEIVDNFGWYAVEGDPEYAPGMNGLDGFYFKTAQALTAGDVAAAVRRYLAKGDASVTLEP
jgi:predicted Zn-dependent peptidase